MQLKEIKKRDGRTEKFDQSKLISSLSQAITSTGLKDNPISGRMAKEVTKYLEENQPVGQIMTTDDIRSAVNIVLLDNNDKNLLSFFLSIFLKNADAKF